MKEMIRSSKGGSMVVKVEVKWSWNWGEHDGDSGGGGGGGGGGRVDNVRGGGDRSIGEAERMRGRLCSSQEKA